MRVFFGLSLAAGLALAGLDATAAGAQPPPGPLVIGAAPVSGALDASSPRDAAERPYHDYVIALESGQRVRIDAIGDDTLDPMIQLLREGGTDPVAEDDDSGEGLDARLNYTVEESGNYVVRVLTFLPDAAGRYSVGIARTAALPDPVPIPAGPPAATTAWTFVNGALATEDPENEGSYFDDYSLRLAVGDEVLIRLDSLDSGGAGFDAVLLVYPPGGREGDPIDRNDDGGIDLNAVLLFRATVAGDHIIRVSSFGTDRRTGAYRLGIGR